MKITGRTIKTFLIFSFFAFFLGLAASFAVDEELVIHKFDAADQGGLPKGWRVFEFPRKHKPTKYTVEKDGGICFLKAESVDSATALYKDFRGDVRQFPFLCWKWKIDGILKKGEEGKRSGDDFAARVYVMFEYEPWKVGYFERLKYRVMEKFYGIKPGNTISYIWANRLKKDSAVVSPFSNMVMMIAAESGEELAGKWVEEKRNIYEDYKKYFKDEPPPITAIAVLTDSDDVHESAVGYYGDMALKRR